MTVKKRWQAIYSRMIAVAPELPASRAAAVADAERRGAEKRRLVLQHCGTIGRSSDREYRLGWEAGTRDRALQGRDRCRIR